MIVAVQDRSAVAVLSKMNAEVMGKDIDPYYGAPTIILVFAPRYRMTYIEDGSCILENILLAAYAVGLGSCWIHRAREMFATDEGRELLKQWGIPDDYVGIGAAALGYVEGEYPSAAERKNNYILRI